MGTYNKPKARLHHEFAYLNHDSVLNSLSAFEAGKVDEIIQKTTAAKEGGIEVGLGVGPVKGSAGKKGVHNIQEELLRTRTWFSAFDAWHKHLEDHESIGTFDVWDSAVREELSVGDTIEFSADAVLSPIHKLFTTFSSFAAGIGSPGSIFAMSKTEAAEMKKAARQMETIISNRSGEGRSLVTYMLPHGIADPRIVARLDERYIVGGLEAIEGRFSIVAQVDALLKVAESESVARVIRDVPPTPKEVETVTEALHHFIEPAKELGIALSDEDLTFSHPTVIVRPVAIFK